MLPHRRIIGMGAAVISVWSPSDLSSVTTWWDFSDKSVLFQDAAKETPVANDGDRVGAIVDKIGNATDFTQITADYKPTFKTAIQNDLDCVSVTQDFLSGTSISLRTLYIVSLVSATSVAHSGVVSATNDSSNVRKYTTANKWRGPNPDSDATDANDFAHNGSAKVNGVATDIHGNAWHIYKVVAAANKNIAQLCGNAYGLRAINGYVGEIIGCSNLVSEADDDLIMNYLSNKWSITIA